MGLEAEDAGVANALGIEGRLHCSQHIESTVADLIREPRGMISPDRMMVGDRPTRRDDRIAHRGLRTSPLPVRIGLISDCDDRRVERGARLVHMRHMGHDVGLASR